MDNIFSTGLTPREFYSRESGWLYSGAENTDAPTDVFFICPTVYHGSESSFNWERFDSGTATFFRLATDTQKEIYGGNSRFFAPYYRQAARSAFDLPEAERRKCVDFAYNDIRAAFECCLERFSGGRPLLLAGFSQGAELCIRLLKEYFSDDALNSRLIACYAIGWRITADELAENPHIRFASGEDDTGVLISYNSEAEEVDDSLFIPKGKKALAINPLNWKTDSTPADCSLNLGARKYDLFGNLISETPGYAGAYIDSVRGALKVTGIPAEERPSDPGFAPGVYHLHDYLFFFRNLQRNVRIRKESWLRLHGLFPADS